MKRRELREHTFKLVFMKEFYAPEMLEEQTQLYLESEELSDYSEEEKELLKERAQAVLNNTEEADTLINQYAKGWQTRRMAKVDLSLIRLALYEIRHDETVPDKVAINEAVELAKKYGGSDSPSFINGILGKIVRLEQ
ncbi:MAG: transcription antitermination factor NusB [Lachnospiraceae bacterium]|nr:transcription antitermination factor NusB [Lachnospiraceae bacterium]